MNNEPKSPISWNWSLDERTPDICKQHHGKSYHGGLPHDTKNPQNPCRCVAIYPRDITGVDVYQQLRIGARL